MTNYEREKRKERLVTLFGESWYGAITPYLYSDGFTNLGKNITLERRKHNVLPPKDSNLIFKAFRVTPYKDVKVVVIGQDIYATNNGAYDGLAFSNSTLLKPQPSLSNILKEVERDIYDEFNLDRSANLSLYDWAKQGVLLINAGHTVIEKKPLSHIHYWMPFTVKIVKALNEKQDIIWLLWGNFAQKFISYINNPTHVIIKSGHPSPLNTTHPFVGCGCFSETNKALEARNLKQIKW